MPPQHKNKQTADDSESSGEREAERVAGAVARAPGAQRDGGVADVDEGDGDADGDAAGLGLAAQDLGQPGHQRVAPGGRREGQEVEGQDRRRRGGPGGEDGAGEGLDGL